VSDLIPDPTEDRLRHAFAERAEDMAPGDAAGAEGLQRVADDAATAPTGQLVARHGARRSGHLLLAAAIVVIVGAALAAVGVVMASDDDSDKAGDLASGDRGGPAVPVVELASAQRALIVALQDERNLAAIDLMGQSALIDVPVDDPAEARRRTDDAIAALRGVVGNGAAASAYQQAMDGLGGLAGLRSDIDADDGPRDMSNVETSNDVFARYAELVGGLLDAEEALAPTIDDPEPRAGVQVHQLGLREQELTAQLARATLLGAVVPPNSASLSEVSRLLLLVRQAQEELIAAAAGTPYEEATAAVVGQIEASGLLDIVDAALGGTTDIAGLLDAVELPADQGWPAFLDRVEQILTAEG
jgi:hypothetical protein